MRRRRPALWPLAVLVVLLVGLPVLSWVRGALEGEPPPLDVSEAVDAYYAVFRVEDRAPGGAAASTEHVWVRRPFDGRVEVRRGSPPGADAVSTIVSGFATRRHASAGQAPLVLTVEPGPPEGDIRIAANLAPATRSGLLTPRGRTREIVGRRCAVYRLPLASPSGREEGDARDLCIDASGLVLLDERVIGGEVLHRREVVTLELEPTFEPGLFDIEGNTVPIDEGGGGLARLTDDSRTDEATVYELAGATPGFEHLGRFAVSPTTSLADQGPTPPGIRIVGVIDVWRSGRDFFAVFNGGADDGREPFPADPRARGLDLGAPGRGELSVTLVGGDARADLGGGRFVRVYGTLPAADLAALARRLEARTGGAITRVE